MNAAKRIEIVKIIIELMIFLLASEIGISSLMATFSANLDSNDTETIVAIALITFSQMLTSVHNLSISTNNLNKNILQVLSQNSIN